MKKAAAVIITNEKDQVLLLKRGDKQRDEQGKWENIGGEVDPKETFQDAAKRETLEELAIELSNLTELFTDKDPKGKWIVKVYSAKTRNKPINNEPEYIDEIKWANKKDLSSIDLASYTKRDFERLGWL